MHGLDAAELWKLAGTVGGAAMYRPDSVNGDSFLIADVGEYVLNMTDVLSFGQTQCGASINATSLTATIASLSYDQGNHNVGLPFNPTVWAPAPYAEKLFLGDIVRPHTDGVADGTSFQQYFKLNASPGQP